MPILRLSIPIIAGKATCAVSEGKFCNFVGVLAFGTKHVCRLFPNDSQSYSLLEDKDGWLQRLPECIQAEKDETQ